jgi:CRISPR/Cas system-associated endoribonuclease Cas2
MKNKISQIRAFLKAANAAFDLIAIQSAFVGNVTTNKFKEIHKLALQESEKDKPDLSIIYNLLSEILSEIENLAYGRKQ